MTTHAPTATWSEVFDTGFLDSSNRRIEYLVTIQAVQPLAEVGTLPKPRAWRVYGQQLRAGRPWGRPSVARLTFSVEDAFAMMRTLFNKHRRYLERNTARAQVRAAAAEEDLERLAGGGQ